MKYLHTISTLLILLSLCTVCHSYDHENVHPLININASKQSIFGTQNYLQHIGFCKGLNTELSYGSEKLTIERWIAKGGTEEDKPDPRVLWHFHDPTYPATQWNKAGLGLNDSALVWAQEPSQSTLFGGTHSWVTARSSFLKALTTGSEAEYAETFRSLGQVMHLISDMAVPAHVRIDQHFAYVQKLRDPYEDYTAVSLKDADYQNSHPVNQAIFTRAVASTFAPAPVSALWDQDACNNNRDSTQTDCTPDKLWTKDKDAGLAEFTNANFLSRDTFGKYAQPNFTGLNLLYELNWHYRPPVSARDKKIDSPAYIWRMADGQRKYRLAAANYFSHDTSAISPGSYWTLDNQVYKDYAAELVPRAIGYSTALLDYFFRGKIELTPPDRFVLGLIDDADFFDSSTGARKLDARGFPMAQVFTQLQAKVRNASEDEMGSGTIQLVARYLRRNDYKPDLSKDPPRTASVNDWKGKFYSYSYSVSLPIWIPSMSKSSPKEYTFNFSNSPIPAGITDLDIFVVFKGTLGQEVDNAVAVGRIAEMNEPFHYSVQNSTDHEIGSTGILYPHPGMSKDFKVCFNPYPGTCQLPLATTLAPGKYSKMILLYAGQALGITYKDTLFATTGRAGWISNLSRSKFLATENNAKTIGFRGIYTHASYLSYNTLYSIDPYSIPAFTNPKDAGFLPFPAMPVRVNMIDY